MKNNISLQASARPFWQKYTGLILFSLAFIMYANIIGNGYNMDDELVTRKHALTSKGISSIGKIFTSPYYSDQMGYSYGYRPVAQATFAIEHQLFGEKPAVSHFFNVIFYALTVLVFFSLLRKMLGEKNLVFAILATILFVVHPIHTEAVASIKNREEILALLLALLSARLFLKFIEKSNVLYWFVIFGLFALALLSKKSVFTLGFLWPVMFLVFKKGTNKNIWILAVGYITIAALIGSDIVWGSFFQLLIGQFVVFSTLWVYIRWNDEEILLYKLPVVRFFKQNAGILLVNCVGALGLLSWFLFPIGIYIPVIFIGAVLLWQILKKQWNSIPFGIFWFLVIGAVFNQEPVLYAGIIFSILNVFFEKRKNGVHTILPIFLVIFSITLSGYIQYLQDASIKLILLHPLLTLAVFLATGIDKKIRLGILLLFSVLLGVLGDLFNYPFLSSILIAVYFYVEHFRSPSSKIWIWVVAFNLFMPLGYVAYNYHFAQTKYTEVVIEEPADETILDEKIKIRSSALPEEGRKLEYAENTLVQKHTFEERVSTVLLTLVHYIKLHVFPVNLSYYYGFAYVETVGLSYPPVIISLVVHLGLIILAVWQFRKRPLLSFGILFYISSIFLFSNAFTLVAGMVGERLAFTASAGFCIFIAAIIVWVKPDLNFKKPGLVEIVVGIICIAFAFRTLVRNTDWKDKITLMGNDIQHLDNSAQANNLYALSLMQESFENKKLRADQQYNMRKLAVQHFDKAVHIWPNFFNAAYDKGRAATIIGDVNSAIEGYEKAVNIGTADGFIDPYIQLGQLYLQVGRHKDFLINAKKLLEKDKKAEAFNAVARGFYLNGTPDSAKIYLRKGMVLNPGEVSLKKNMAEIFKAESQLDSMNYWLAQ